MKKIVSLLASVVLLSSLVGITACGGKIDPATCDHLTHDENAVCLACGTQRKHNFIDGSCSICEKTTPFLWNSIAKNQNLMDEIKSGNYESGTIEKLQYETPAFNIETLTGEQKVIEKTAYVYLPASYDRNKEYDLIVLLHGSTDSEGYWFAQGEYRANDLGKFFNTGNYTKEMLDYLIGSNKMKPTIVVTPSLYNEHENYQTENKVVTKQLGKELMGYLLPAVAQNYSTFVKGIAESDFIAARDHIAYCGLSMGGFTAMDSILSYCLPYFSYVANFSGNSTDLDTVMQGIDRDAKSYPIRYWFLSCGTADGTVQYDGVKEMYQTITSRSSFLTDGKNCTMVDIKSANHTYECFLTGLYNALQVFFK